MRIGAQPEELQESGVQEECRSARIPVIARAHETSEKIINKAFDMILKEI